MRIQATRLLVSIFLIYHLVAVLLFPNPYSVLARSLQPIFNSYGNLFGLNTTWQFFSPNPGQLRYIEYDVIVETESNIDISHHKWPPQDGSIYFKENLSRRFYHAVRTIMSPQSQEELLVPFLCRKHKNATSIAIKAVQKFVPTLERAKVENADSFSQLLKEIEVTAAEFGCQREAKDEIS